MSTRRRRRLARSTGVSLELSVLEYLREVSERTDRDRSFCINQIVREHAERNGWRLSFEGETPAEAEGESQ
jgi:metal-responsive CopG/Arc/MetJ family transcriptional regulator